MGLAVGDALGTAVEFSPPGTFKPVTHIMGGGPFRLKAGQWTDDTSMALCLAESLIEKRMFDPIDQLQRYVRWHREGYLSSTGACFDIGGTTLAGLKEFERTGAPYSGSLDGRAAGNGSLMRLVPVPMFFAVSPEDAVARSGDSSRTTHAAQVCVDACRYFGGILVGALRGVAKDELLADRYSPIPGYWQSHPLAPPIDAVARGSFKHKDPPDIRGAGYVVQSLEAALWAFHRGADFREGALLAVNLGDDADTTGAVYGQLAGACYGFNAIPERWRTTIAQADLIIRFADDLARLAVRG